MGYSNDNSSDDWSGFYCYGNWEPAHKPQIDCECGTKKVLGENDDPQFHSNYCAVYKEYVKNKK